LFSTLDAPAQDAAATARLQSIGQEQNLLDPALKPWHLKMTVQLFDQAGRPTETGTVEEWWAAPDKYRQVFSTPSYTATRLTKGSDSFHTPGSGSLPYALEELLRLATHPVDTDAELPQAFPELVRHKLGPTDAECIVLDKQLKGIKVPPLGLYPTYCVLSGSNALVLRSEISELSVLSALGTYKGKHYPVDLQLQLNSIKVASEHVMKLEPVADTADEFNTTDGLTSADDKPVSVAPDAINGKMVKSLAPIYPERARENRVTGTVVLHAIIGTDGRIHKLNLVSAPDVDLAVSAAVAVRQWVYKPYMLNGTPTAVETTVNVNYQFGP
jgi:TonB family protein